MGLRGRMLEKNVQGVGMGGFSKNPPLSDSLWDTVTFHPMPYSLIPKSCSNNDPAMGTWWLSFWLTCAWLVSSLRLRH